MTYLSIIVPVYNEEKRIKPFLNALLYFTAQQAFTYEVLIVDDGSCDKTVEVITSLVKDNPNYHIISYSPNKGKAHALKTGFAMAKGDYEIFIDADGSIHPCEINEMLKKLTKYDVVVGNRASKESKVIQPLIRKIATYFFNHYVNFLFNLGIKDTLCGFKGFRKAAAKNLFSQLVSERWIFDVELFWRIKHNGYTLYQMPIVWNHKDGAKIKLLSDPIKMFLQLIKLRRIISREGGMIVRRPNC